MIERALAKTIENRFGTVKTILLIGLRQVGKTAFFNKILEGEEYLFLNGDDPIGKELLSNSHL